MKNLNIMAVVLTTAFFIPITASAQTTETKDSVYVCGKNATGKYHLTGTCRGLNACKQPLQKIPKSEAIKERELCGWED